MIERTLGQDFPRYCPLYSMYTLVPSWMSIEMTLLLQAVVICLGIGWMWRWHRGYRPIIADSGAEVQHLGPSLPTSFVVGMMMTFVYGLIPILTYWQDGATYRHHHDLSQELVTIITAQILAFIGLGCGYFGINNYLGDDKASAPLVLTRPIITSRQAIVSLALLQLMVLAELVYSSGGLSFLNPWSGVSIFHQVHKISGIKSLGDTLMILLMIAPSVGVGRRWLGMFALVFVSLAMVEGVRYRVVILFLGWLILYVPKYWQLARPRVRVGLVMAVLAIGLTAQLWSANRWAIAKKQYQYLTLNPIDNGGGPISEFSQTYVGASVLAFSNQQQLGPDNGATSFGFIGIRFLPKQLLAKLDLTALDRGSSDKKPFPPMLHRVVHATSESGEYRKGVPAYGAMQEIFLAFGFWSGLVWVLVGICCGLLGGLMWRFLGSGSLAQNYIQAIGIAFWFQWITRGYLPQQAELLLFLTLPPVVWLVSKSLKKAESPSISPLKITT